MSPTTTGDLREPGAVVRETHSGLVVLAGDLAYKVKRPVDLGFLDFSTVGSRRRAIHRELVLNRRFAPDVYLGTLDVVDADGQPVDRVLVMRRLPDDRRLATLLLDPGAGDEVVDQLRRVARIVAAAHSGARTGGEVDREGSPDALRARWADNLSALRHRPPRYVDPEQVEQLAGLAEDFVEGCRPLLESRVREHHVRDGHGDLLADDVFCLADGPRVLDCLDFDDRLRWMDVLDDVACLAMDVERLGGARPADAFLADYAEFSGVRQPRGLADHYVGYRAVMRAKVTALRDQEASSSDPFFALTVVALLDLARRHLLRARPRLVLVGGGPGTGKSTLAGALADRSGAVLLSSDRLRKELAGLPAAAHRPSGFGTGLYSPERSRATYDALGRRAEDLLRRGEHVVVDASFTPRWARDRLLAAAAVARDDTVALRCVAPDAVVRARLRRRSADPTRESDADEEVARRLGRAADPWPEATDVDGTRPTRELVAQLWPGTADRDLLPCPHPGSTVTVGA